MESQMDKMIAILKAHNIEVKDGHCLERYTIDGQLHTKWIPINFKSINDLYIWLGY